MTELEFPLHAALVSHFKHRADVIEGRSWKTWVAFGLGLAAPMTETWNNYFIDSQ